MRRNEEDFRRMKLQQERREKLLKKERQQKLGFYAAEEETQKETQKEDYWAHLRERAIMHSQPPVKAKTIITHLGRQSKNQQMYDKQRQFQLQYDFEGLAETVHRERKNLYLDKNAYEFMKTTSSSSNFAI
mmetsp:Transcript_24707/g.33047  ORF Transcript_24707/g.33047 Transcript_24707/m.33047 type:complete len:131 (-) Transcript_24707:303-695(-)|eukprot:CAMPEP_0185590542 /NCGR_PEP_ID=MMETSP0434-20130131/61121_1 /TAXON_ID=626734 ORGANISM="Favella taraikaensis, Strain Fe Narragansett Bay" /NCGR_SAMPLE_ID=MMETSP0434 /ASSEMBLY_ACC=CAM_ASM_000379 /LENGTH=130 /DNA_ID=CAMNT_0028214811 /DNA_START=208 /DNA_END=600 /DNA_ORIENTATION=-